MIADLIDAAHAITYALIGWIIALNLLLALGIAAVIWAVRAAYGDRT